MSKRMTLEEKTKPKKLEKHTNIFQKSDRTSHPKNAPKTTYIWYIYNNKKTDNRKKHPFINEWTNTSTYSTERITKQATLLITRLGGKKKKDDLHGYETYLLLLLGSRAGAVLEQALLLKVLNQRP